MNTRRYTLALMALLALSAGPSWADTLQVIPYDGALEQDGAAVDGSRAVRFILYDSDGAEVWREERSDEASTDCASACQVTFYRGEFSVLLGEHAALPEAALSSPFLYLGLEIRRVDGAWIALQGRQVITPTPFALWSARGDALEVAGDLTTPTLTVEGQLNLDNIAPSISGAMTVSGALTAASLSVTGAITSNGTLSVNGDLNVTDGGVYVGRYDVQFGSNDAYGNGGRALVHLSGDRLQINHAGDFSGGVEVEGILKTLGDCTVSGTAEVTGEFIYWGDFTGRQIEADKPLVLMRYISMGTSTTANTGIATEDYVCSIGGWILGKGDINEGGEQHIKQMYTYINGSNWWVAADFVSHSDEHETHEVLVVCFQATMSNTNTGWSAP